MQVAHSPLSLPLILFVADALCSAVVSFTVNIERIF